MSQERLEYIARVLMELIKLAEHDKEPAPLLIYFMTMALAEADERYLLIEQKRIKFSRPQSVPARDERSPQS